MAHAFELQPGTLTLKQIRMIQKEHPVLSLASSAHPAIEASFELLKSLVVQGKTIYGVNTGFGKLANQVIPNDKLADLQKKLILSHTVGTGANLSASLVELILLLKTNSLAQGYSGVRLELIEALIAVYNSAYRPCIPSQGSVGASGDLAPLAHMSAALIGYGSVQCEQKTVDANDMVQALALKLLPLAPKEGLALLNGTQVSTALAVEALIKTQDLFETALISGALSLDAIKGSIKPFDARIQKVRRLSGQQKVAMVFRTLLEGSALLDSHASCSRVQDPYSIRCQPQVMGACLDQIHYAQNILENEINAVTDNPLVFTDTQEVLSGGNFHAEPVAFVSDALAVVLAEIGQLSERRSALMLDSNLSLLPPFLISDAGLNSGFMIAQVTAAALVSENKCLAVPASIDSIPTSANQEDHVSMATYAARRLHQMVDNVGAILAIELQLNCQALDFHAPLHSSVALQKVYKKVRSMVPFYSEDQYMAEHLALLKKAVLASHFCLRSVSQLDVF